MYTVEELLKAIRKHCIECAGSEKESRECTVVCELNKYRTVSDDEQQSE